MKVGGVTGNDGLGSALGADGDVSIGNVGGPGAGQEESDGGRVGTIEGNEVGGGLADQAREAGLAGGTADGLGESRGGDGDAHAAFGGAGDESEDTAVIAVEGDQAAGVECDAAHAAFPFRFCGGEESSESAQARSFFVRGPPDCWSASDSISRHPAASERATATACWTKAETLGACRAATRARTSSS